MKNIQEIKQNFRIEIRNRQKQQYFKKIRNQVQEQFNKQKSIIISNLSRDKLPLNGNNQQSLKYMIQEINNGKIKICAKINENNIYIQLMDNLKKGIYVELSLNLISSIVSKQKIKMANKFVRNGLIEEMVRYSQYGSNYVSLCMNILGNIVYENVEYAEIMLQAKIHTHMISLIQKLILSNENICKQVQDIGFSIMWAMSTLCEVERNEQYKQQYLQILAISLQVFKRSLYQRIILEIIFLIGFSFKKQTKSAVTWALNRMVNEVSSDYQNLKQLLIVIRLLSPIDIDYSKIASLILTTQPILASYGVKVLQKVALTHSHTIPRNMEWWERVFLKLTRPECKQTYINLLKKVKIKNEWVYNIIKEILETQYMNITLIHETLTYISSVFEDCKSIQEKRHVKYYMKSYGIVFQLQQLYKHKNREVSRKSQCLINAINSDYF